MTPRPNVSEARKQQILEAASVVFTSKGFYETRMEDIADQTGLSKGTLYNYFNSKDDLIIAILNLLFQREFDHMERMDYTALGATQAIWKVVDMALEDYTEMLSSLPMAYEFLALAFRNKPVQEALRQYFDRYMEFMTPIIQYGIDQGEFRELDAKDVAIATGAIFEGTILLWVYDKQLVDPVRHIHSGIEYLLAGIQAS